jgi:hypothetical protein
LTLSWHKFRILPLNGEKQRELVNNTFLRVELKRIVLHHLAHSGSLGATPLFLTLLCRYVQSVGTAPTNDFDLLSLHIDGLAKRDPVYLKTKYNLTPSELLAGAQEIARLFAEQPSLGLAPTLDQITALVELEKIAGSNIELLLSAMVDFKIGRADVPNAAQGDRRFAFAHRRYQETLFVRFLVTNPAHLGLSELLTDPRWREYTVTLLQTEPIINITLLLIHASSLIEQFAMDQAKVTVQPPIPSRLGYFNWKQDLGVALIELLQEGLARRNENMPEQLSNSVQLFLQPRWETGDSYDRCEVLRLCALIPQELLVEYIAEAFNTGTARAEYFAFQQTTVLKGEIPSIVKNAVLKRLSAETFTAKDTAALLRIEALTGRLPSSIGATYVYRRSLRLRNILKILGKSILLPFPIKEIKKVQVFIDNIFHIKIFRTQNDLSYHRIVFLGALILSISLQTLAVQLLTTCDTHICEAHIPKGDIFGNLILNDTGKLCLNWKMSSQGKGLVLLSLIPIPFYLWLAV